MRNLVYSKILKVAGFGFILAFYIKFWRYLMNVGKNLLKKVNKTGKFLEENLKNKKLKVFFEKS